MTKRIAVVGLGSGDESRLTLGVWRMLEKAGVVHMRTERHPVAEWLRRQGICLQSFDDLYEAHGQFEEVYEAIVARLLALASDSTEEVIYAVPGHPSVAERTTRLLRERCPAAGVELRVVGGESFLDEAFVRLGFDPIDGFLLLDAADLQPHLLQPQVHTLIAQVYDAMTASDVKLALMERYPDAHEVIVGHALGIEGEERILCIPLLELDRQPDYGNLSLVWIPRNDREELRVRSFDRLHEIVEVLRSPGGCPWDREQTHVSLRKHFIEETYEVLETIDDDDPAAMCEELGDVLLQIMLHAQIEEERGVFHVYDVVAGLNEKLVRRHPHVFGERQANNAEEALVNWERAKREEKAKSGMEPDKPVSVLAGIPRDLPAVQKAWKLQKKAAAVGFDWDRIGDVAAKVREELDELLAESEPDRQKDEFGDLLFAVVNLSRFLKIDPEESLISTNRKFVARFSFIEDQLRLKGKSFADTSLLEMEEYWQQAKKVMRPPLL